MNHRIVSTFILSALLSLAGPLSTAHADEKGKLEQLEQAVKAPPKQYGTRRIVLDNETETPEAAAPLDCTTLPADSSGVNIDFVIQFRMGSADIAPASAKTLQQIAKILALNTQRCILVEGHTDATGDAERNMALSRDRAAAVVEYIVGKAGMDRTRLVPIGKGQTDPLKNLDPRNPKNRRVVFKVVG